MHLVVLTLSLALAVATASLDQCSLTSELGEKLQLALDIGFSCVTGFQEASNVSTPPTEDNLQALDTICTAECGGAIYDYVQQCSDFDQAEGVRLWCLPSDSEAAVSRCRFAFPDAIDLEVLNNTDILDCLDFNFSSATCPGGCSTGLTRLVSEIGCCFQSVYNTSLFLGSDRKKRDVTEEQFLLFVLLTQYFGVWTSCEVPIPDQCLGDSFPLLTTDTTTESGGVNLSITIIPIVVGMLVSII